MFAIGVRSSGIPFPYVRRSHQSPPKPAPAPLADPKPESLPFERAALRAAASGDRVVIGSIAGNRAERRAARAAALRRVPFPGPRFARRAAMARARSLMSWKGAP